MRLQLTASHPRSLASIDVTLDTEPTTPVGAVVDHLATLLGLPQTERGIAFVGGSPLDLAKPLAGSPLVEGVDVAIGAPLVRMDEPYRSRPSIRVVSGVGAGTVGYLDEGTIVIGTELSCGIRLTDPSVPEFAAYVTRDAAGVTLLPAAGAGVIVGGVPVTGPTLLAPETEIRIGDTLLELGEPFHPDAAVTRSSDEPSWDYARPPRLLPAERKAHFKLPSPPKESLRRPLSWISVAAPLVVSLATAFLFHNVSFLAFALLSPIMLVANNINDRRTGRVSFRARMQQYDELVARIEGEADAAMAEERVDRRRRAPDAATVLEIAVGRRARLWERRRTDDDYLSVRLGTADLPSDVVLDDPEQLEHRREVARVATDVPVVVDVRKQGVIGIAGPADTAAPLAGFLLGQLAALQSPRDTQFYVITPGAAGAAWEWVRWLPHARPALGQSATVLLGNDAETAGRRVAELGRIIDERKRALESVARNAALDAPDLVVVIDGARRMRALPGLVRVLRDGPAVGVFAICVDAEPRLLPEECSAVVALEGTKLDLVLQRQDAVRGARADLVAPSWFQQLGRALAPLKDLDDDEVAGALPPSSRLLDVVRLDPPTDAAVLARWRAIGRTTQLVIGESVDGPFGFDLRRDGPHGLIAGTTGSGKSELLQSIVASLAIANRPDAMTFVLVDYKGGAAFKDAVDLPHTVGMVTDLDAHLVERALASLGAELRRREHILAAVGAKDIEDYTELAERAGHAPLPRLVIVIDEFASLVRELPDFVTGLVNIAQRGRSLGIHLLLATQRPSGVVTPEIRANTNLRIALRVTDAGESSDVINAPDAARISKNTPGRGYISLGAGALLPFQAGRVGGKRITGQSERAVPIWSAPVGWSSLGRPLPEPPQTEERVDAGETDLQALVKAVSAAAAAAGIPPQHRPWLDALPTSLVLGQLPVPALGASTGESPDWSLPPIPYGLRDVPELQQQPTALFDLESDGHLFVVGSPRSGRSQVLRTIAASIAMRISAEDVHLYGLDCGNGALLPLTGLAHTGAVVTRTQTERAARLFAKLADEASRRQDLLGSLGVANITEQRQAAPAGERLPHIVVLLDRWEGFTTTLGELDGGKLIDEVLALLREGASLGIHLILSGDRTLLTGRISTLVEDKLVLRLSERGDYSYAGIDHKKVALEVPNGRAYSAPGALETQIALLVPDPTGQAQAAALEQLGRSTLERDAAVPPARRPFRLDVLPSVLSFEDAWGMRDPALGHPGGRWALVGVGGDELKAIGPRLDDGIGTFLLAGPAKSGRSTVLLTMAKSLLRQGAELVIFAPRPSPLRELAGQPGVVAVVTDAELDVAVLESLLPPTAHGRLLLMDDGEVHAKSDARPWLQAFVRSAADNGQGVVVGGLIGEVAGGLTGWQVDMKRGRRGALLSPQSPTDGEILGLRIPRSALVDRVQPGRVLLHLGDGELLSVQSPIA